MRYFTVKVGSKSKDKKRIFNPVFTENNNGGRGGIKRHASAVRAAMKPIRRLETAQVQDIHTKTFSLRMNDLDVLRLLLLLLQKQ
jgi:hypothetical protein